MNLLELQRRMANDVRRPLTADFSMQPRTEDGTAMDDHAATYIKPNDSLTSFDRLEIYNRQYWFRVIGAVSEDYPALAAILGARRFDALILAYLQQNPSTSFSLRDLGARLPGWLPLWLGENPAFAPTRHALLLDVASLEWAYIESFDSAALPPLELDHLAALTADSRLLLQPHLRLLDLGYPVDELVLAVHKAAPPAETASNAVSERKQSHRPRLPRMRRTPIHLAVHRFDNSVYYRRIDREAYLLLAGLQQRLTLAQAIEAAFRDSSLTPTEQAQVIQQTFAHAAELGWFCHG